MNAMRGKANNVHSVFPITLCNLDIPRMRIVVIQWQDKWIFSRKLHKTDRMFNHCVKIIFLLPPAL